MELIAILSDREDDLVTRLKGLLHEYTTYPVRSLEELVNLQHNIPVNLLIIDTSSCRFSSLADLIKRLDDEKAVILLREQSDTPPEWDLPSSVYGLVNISKIAKELPLMVDSALEKQRLKNELSFLRRAKKDSKQIQNSYNGVPANGVRYLKEKVLINFAKVLTASFDMSKLLSHFMDSIMEIARVNRMSIMLKDKEAFHIKTHYGLDPYIADNLKLKNESALISILTKSGRILEMPSVPDNADSASIRNDMKLLRCSFSFPMLHNGTLIGIFNIGDKITAEPFRKDELEIIYMLCNYLASAVKDIDLHNKMWYQEEFTKNILSSMNSGMIVIDRDKKITVFNQQAAEIINLNASDMIGSNVSLLPSPLGDILYETMVAGSSYKRFETEVTSSKLPLGITSYRLFDEKKDPIGAGIVFSDLSDSKKLDIERMRAERLEAVNELMSKIAHEVRNPLTSIQTYAQLINDKYGNDDDELNNFYKSSVTDSIHRLDDLIDKLVTFSITQEYNFYREDVSTLLDESVSYLIRHIPKGYKIIKDEIIDNVFIYADRKLFIKAIYFLVISITERSAEGAVITLSARILSGLPSVEIHINFGGDEMTEEEKLKLLRPLFEIDILTSELNLPISRKIIEKHKGSLDISTGKDGNTFIIKLPAIDGEAAKISINGES